jgi:hypothetical protein
MIPFLIPLLTRLPAVRAFLKANAVWIALAVLTLVICASGVFLYTRGQSAGKAEVQVRVEKEHTETIREVRGDEQLAQKITDDIAARLAATQAEQRATTTQTTKEITDAFHALPALPVGTVDRPAPVSVREASNSLVDRANRAATYAGPAD